MTEIKASPNIKCCDKHLKFRLAVSAGLEIGHFEKTQGEKTQNSRKKLNNSRKKLNFCRVVVQNHVSCY